jgi:hypothetical protein
MLIPSDFMSASMEYIKIAAPFMICFTVVAISEELIGLLKKAALGMFRRTDY